MGLIFMKRITFFTLLFIFLLLPKNVLAYQLSCDSNIIEYNQNLFCHLSGQANQNFELFSGNITSTDNLISCTPISYGAGLSKIDDSSSFVLSGTTQDETIVTFSCYLNEKLTEVKKTQIKIDDFKYKLEHEAEENSNEILSSDFINANIYKEEIETDDKPRNTTNPDSLLATLSEDNLHFTFSRFVTIYTQEVLYEVDHLNLNIIPNNANAKVRIVGNDIENNTNLNIGENIIDIYVTSSNGTTTCYTLYVTRLVQGEEIYYPESDASLFSLIVPGYAIHFNKDVYEYKIHLTRDISKLTVNAVPTYDEANVNISSTENLHNGSIIKISVVSKDKTTTLDYTIRITKDAPKQDYTPYIVLGIVTVTLIILVIIFIKTSQNKKNNKQNINNNELSNNIQNSNFNSNGNKEDNIQLFNDNLTDNIQNQNVVNSNNNNEFSAKREEEYNNINQEMINNIKKDNQ